MSSDRSRSLALAGAVAAIALAAFLKTNHLPLYDAALFEYAGRAILRDQHLYAYVWDNKLPPIYYLNALYQQLFGERYALHLAAEIVLNLGSVYLFWIIACAFRLARPRAATFVFAALLLLPPSQFNQVEYPALLLILAAYVAWLRERAIFTGILLALAATFWIPSMLLLIPLLADQARRSFHGRAIVAALMTVLACAALFNAGFGVAAMRELGASWLAYGSQTLTFDAVWSNFYRGALLSGAGLALAVSLCLVRRPQSATERVLLWWAALALAGAAASLRFYPHYFAVALAPLVLYAFRAGFTQAAVPRRVAAAVLACFFVWKSSLSIAGDTQHHWQRASRVAILAKRVTQLREPRYISVAQYEPGIYLAGDVPLRSKYEIVAQPNSNFLNGRDLNTSLVRLHIDMERDN